MCATKRLHNNVFLMSVGGLSRVPLRRPRVAHYFFRFLWTAVELLSELRMEQSDGTHQHSRWYLIKTVATQLNVSRLARHVCQRWKRTSRVCNACCAWECLSEKASLMVRWAPLVFSTPVPMSSPTPSHGVSEAAAGSNTRLQGWREISQES